MWLFIKCFFVGCGAAFLLRLMGHPKHITSFFEEWYGVLWQSLTADGRVLARKFRKENKGKPLNIKLIAVERFFSKRLKELLSALEIGRVYRCNTHLLHLLQRRERDEILEIVSCKKAGKRWLVGETITLIGLRAFLQIALSSERRTLLYKQFYRITFIPKK